MSFLDELKMGYASVAAPHLYRAQMEREKDKQLSLISSMIARQAPSIMEPIMGKALNPTHAAMMETLKRAMMSPDPELQHEAYKMLSNNQDRTFSAINPTDLVKNFQAGGIDVASPENRDLLLQAILKPQTQVNIGDKPAAMEYIKNYRNPVTMKPIPVKPGITLPEMEALGGVIAPQEPVVPLKTIPADLKGAYLEDEDLLSKLKDALVKLEATPEAFGPGNIISNLFGKLGQPALRLQEKYLEGVPNSELDTRNAARIAAGNISATARHTLSGAVISPKERPDLAESIVDSTDSPEIVRNKLKYQIADLTKKQEAFRRQFSQDQGYEPLVDRANLPTRTTSDGTTEVFDAGNTNKWIKDTTPNVPGTVTVITAPSTKAERKVVKRAKDAIGQEWVLYDDGTEEKVNGQ